MESHLPSLNNLPKAYVSHSSNPSLFLIDHPDVIGIYSQGKFGVWAQGSP